MSSVMKELDDIEERLVLRLLELSPAVAEYERLQVLAAGRLASDAPKGASALGTGEGARPFKNALTGLDDRRRDAPERPPCSPPTCR